MSVLMISSELERQDARGQFFKQILTTLVQFDLEQPNLAG